MSIQRGALGELGVCETSTKLRSHVPGGPSSRVMLSAPNHHGHQALEGDSDGRAIGR